MKTLALVIGNNEYYENSKLDNAVNDATAIAEVFKRLNYDVIEKLNFKENEIGDILNEFDTRIKDYDSSIFFFAGHGFEVEGENYLASISCQVTSPNKHHCRQSCIKLSELLSIYKNYKTKINIVIIDACRRSFDRGGVVGFSPIQAPTGTLLAFSTSPNEGAKDKGFNGNSIYTGALLKYIGRERLSVEELFKKVRKTVHTLSQGSQTTWEHTSLIGDFYFNTGQLVHSCDIPYEESVVKDIDYVGDGKEFGHLILKLKSYDWNIQNPAIDKLLRISTKNIDKNQQFILGRNLLQSSGAAHGAQQFMSNLKSNISRYDDDGQNHLLNGLLFEVYFDSHGEFRKEKTKKHYFEDVMNLRKHSRFANSFEFIRTLILAQNYPLVYIPEQDDKPVDVDVVAHRESVDRSGTVTDYDVVTRISFNSLDITKNMLKYDVYRRNDLGLKQALSNFLSAPQNLIQIHCGVELKRISLAFDEDLADAWQ